MTQQPNSNRVAPQRFERTRALDRRSRASLVCGVVLGLVAMAAAPAGAVDTIDMDDAPVFLLSGVAPNLILSLDSSASMSAANSSAEDGVDPEFGPRDTLYLSNSLYYDPSVVYQPPEDASGTQVDHADFNAALRDFFPKQVDPAGGYDCVLDLGANYAPIWDENADVCGESAAGTVGVPGSGNVYSVDVGHPTYIAYKTYLLAAGISVSNAALGTQWAEYCLFSQALPNGFPPTGESCPAFYYVWDPTGTYGGGQACPSDSTEFAPDQIPVGCLKRIIVGTDEEVAATDELVHQQRAERLSTAGEVGTALDDDFKKVLARRNFANWYSFYRNRWRTLQSAISRVLKSLEPTVRVAYQSLDPLNTTHDVYLEDLLPSFGVFDSSRRETFLDVLYAEKPPITGKTALLSAALRAEKFCGSDLAYLDDPTQALGASLGGGRTNQVLACRNNFHLMFTDGVWEDTFGTGNSQIHPSDYTDGTGEWLANNDGTDTALPSDRQYADAFDPPITAYGADDEAHPVYGDDNSSGIADIVFHSWISDLRPDENGDDHRVPTLIWDPTVPQGEDEGYIFWNAKNDPADWQHITTYTIGFGMTGNVEYDSGDYDVGGNTENIYSAGFPGDWDAINGGTGGESDPFLDFICPIFPNWPGCAGYTPGGGGAIPKATDLDKVDDLWHAGINGRGGYSSASNPQALIESFESVLEAVSDVAKQSASAVSPTFNSGSGGTKRMVFQASLNSSDWTGDLKAFQVSGGSGVDPCPNLDVPKGDLCEDPAEDQYFWSAAKKLDDPSFPVEHRDVFTATASYSGGTKSQEGVDFDPDEWTSLTELDQRALLGLGEAAVIPEEDSADVEEIKAVIEYVAGVDPVDYTFRERDSLLGDIINAGPTVVTQPSRYYNDPAYQALKDPESPEYSRTEIVYAGANDGMLHAFDISDGTELFAYVPRPIFRKLKKLADPAYGGAVAHDNFVDGPIAEGDAYFSGAGKWKSVVVGALGLGAQAVYAIHSPTLPGSLVANDIHLWDFTDVDDPDMGYVTGKPSIVRVLMSDGTTTKWVAVFGNGYNSSENDSATGGRRAEGCEPAPDPGALDCGRAVLYVVDIETGALVAKFDTLVGRSLDPNHADDADKEPNGLAEPKVLGRVITDEQGDVIGGGDPIATVAYAGDLFGNLWRFNLYKLSATSTVGEEPDLVFSAANADGIAQPITSGVEVVSHPTGVGAIVLFGTGRYLGVSDVMDTAVQSFYGIWDKGMAGEGTPLVSRDALLVQQFEKTDLQSSSGGGLTLGRTSSRNTIDWNNDLGWVLDLIETDNNLEKGERVVYAPVVHVDRVVFVSTIPETNPCKSGGLSWVNALAYSSGSALDETPFDYDLNGLFDSEDKLVDATGDTKAGSSIRMAGDGGVYSGPSSLALPGGITKTVVSSSEGDLIELLESSVLDWRVWRQLQ